MDASLANMVKYINNVLCWTAAALIQSEAPAAAAALCHSLLQTIIRFRPLVPTFRVACI